MGAAMDSTQILTAVISSATTLVAALIGGWFLFRSQRRGREMEEAQRLLDYVEQKIRENESIFDTAGGMTGLAGPAGNVNFELFKEMVAKVGEVIARTKEKDYLLEPNDRREFHRRLNAYVRSQGGDSNAFTEMSLIPLLVRDSLRRRISRM